MYMTLSDHFAQEYLNPDLPIHIYLFRRWKASLTATRVVLLVLLLVVTPIRKMPKALLIRNGKLRNLAYTFMTSLPPGLPS